MPPKKYAIKGQPDFHNISDEKLKSFLDLTQQMIFAYNRFDDAKVEVLRAIWKDLSDEDIERFADSAVESLNKAEEPSPMIRKVPKIRKSPAKRKI